MLGGAFFKGLFYVKVAPSRKIALQKKTNMPRNVPLTFLLSSLFCFKQPSQKVWKGPQDYVIITVIVFTIRQSKTHSKPIYSFLFASFTFDFYFNYKSGVIIKNYLWLFDFIVIFIDFSISNLSAKLFEG